jgi:hypothetical protein
LDICSTFKARYAGASNYTYTFAPLNPGMGGGVITAIGAITLSNPSLNLIPGQAYNVSVTATFANLVNGIGQQLPNIITQANGACVVAVAAHSDIQVRSSQRCSTPATLLRSSYMRTDPFVCGVTNYTFEFTPTSGCADYLGIGLPFTLVNSSRILQLNFNGSTTSPLGQTLQAQTYYIVRIRPNFSVNGSVQGSYGSPQIIFVGGSLMAMEDQIDGSNFDTYSDEADAFQVYPNPNFGDRLMVESGTGEGRLSLELFDQLGRSIEVIEIEADNGFYLEWVFKNQLSNGLYHVRLTNGQAIYQQKFMVTK